VATRTLKVLAADDEMMARKRVARMLSSMDGVELVATCASGDEALRQLEDRDIDVAVLDIRMPGRTGLELSEVAAELGVEVIFATAHTDHAVDAFDRGVVDYVVKPVEAPRLAVALERARQRILSAEANRAAAPASVDRLAVPVRGEIRLVDPKYISHAELEGELVRLWVGGEGLWIDESLQELERRLPTGSFERVHRRAVINLARVDRLRPLPTGGYTAVTFDGHEVPVSRQAARGLRRRLRIG